MAVPQYPVNLVLSGAPVLVVGGGAVAGAKVRGLIDGGADEVTVVAPHVLDEIEVLESVTVQRRRYEPPEAARYRLVIAATDDPAVNKRVADDARHGGVLVNSVDDPANCTFTSPARIRRGDLLVTVSTAGRSPALAAWVRAQLSAEISNAHAELLDLLADERDRIHAAGRSTEHPGWRRALDSGMLELMRQGRRAEALELLEQCLSSSSD